jgi:hypothetical protein
LVVVIPQQLPSYVVGNVDNSKMAIGMVTMGTGEVEVAVAVTIDGLCGGGYHSYFGCAAVYFYPGYW